MPALTTHLLELTQLGSDIIGVFDLPQKHCPQPGQYIPCQRVGDTDQLPKPLFRVFGGHGQPSLGPTPASWNPGDRLLYTPPQGHGFTLPNSARRVGLVPFDVSPTRVLSLVVPALDQGAEIAVYCDSGLPIEVLSRIPSRVEVLSLSALSEDPTWPEYVAVDLERMSLAALLDRFELFKLSADVDVLVRTPMPCLGIGACGVCAVDARRGYRFACSDGPVFPLKGLRHVAG